MALARAWPRRTGCCSAADWSAFTRGCLDESNASLTDIEAADAVIWQWFRIRQGSRVEASSVTRVIGILAQDGAPPVVGQVVSDLAARRAGESVHPHQFLKPQSRMARPGRHAIRHRQPARHAGSQQIAAGGRLPIQHFANAEHAGHGAQHQARRQRIEAHAPAVLIASSIGRARCNGTGSA